MAPLTFSGFIAALVAALWAYDGWNNVSMVSSEIKDPQRNLPRALIGGTLCVIAIYMLANAAYFHVMTPSEVAGSTRVAAEMMRKIFQAPGRRGGVYCGHDQHFRGVERFHPVGSPRALCGGARRILLPRDRPGEPETSYSRSVNYRT